MQAALLMLSLCVTQPREPDVPLPPREAAARMTVPEGFKVSLFAGEPDVVQPIAFTFDDRGRLWVCECYSYPNWHSDPSTGKDRVLIFEDTNGDGQFDKRTVFADKLSNLSGIEYGFGGIWLCSLPNLIYIPIKAGTDEPGGPAVIKLDGWSMKSGHNVFSNIKWGPDGWLYGCNGILATSRVGPPGTPDKERVPINCGVWRYHPTRQKFEAYAHGTTNPWGLDWDEHGEMFITNCVIAHLWHVVPGAHFERMFGQDLTPNTYGLLKSCADHIHWAGGSWTSSRGGQGAHGEAGGGHAHIGCMIYLGDNWPQRYRNGVFMCNLHGTRVNHDILERNGSSYVARHGRDFLFANDPWFRGLAINYGPDGGVFVTDWSDTGECHNYKIADKKTGRIFKVVYGKVEYKQIDLAKLSDEELVKLQNHRNDWYVRHARRILQERGAAEKLKAGTEILLYMQFGDPNRSQAQQLRSLWALNSLRPSGMLADDLALLQYSNPHVRAWILRLCADQLPGSNAMRSRFERLLPGKISPAKDSSPLVRLAYASMLQRFPPADRIRLATEIITTHDDSSDPYLPWMLWYAIEPYIASFDGSQTASSQVSVLLTQGRVPLLRELIARRLVAQNDDNIGMLLGILADNDIPPLHRDVLRGLQEAVAGRRSIPMPPAWKALYPRLVESPLPIVREQALALAAQFGDERASVVLRKLLVDDRSAPRLRQNALQTLLLNKPADLAPTLQDLLKDPVLREPVLRGLGAYNDPKTPQFILDRFAKFNDDEKAAAIQTLSSRVSYATALLDALEKKQVERDDLSNFTVRQLQALGNKDITARLNVLWGAIRPASEEKAKLLAKYKATLTPEFLKKANKSNGRALYAKSCAACHRLFDEGNSIGPEITGSQRSNLDYILENMVDPSAVVQREFQVAIVTTTGGRTISGIVKQETERAVTLQTPTEVLLVPRDEIDVFNRTKNSMMPDGLLDNLRPEDVRDLVAYLASPVQVPLPRPAENKK